MLTAAVLGFVISGLLFALVGAWGPWRRWPVVILYLCSLVASGLVVIELGAGPMPIAWEWRSGQPELVAADWVEGKTIWLWLRWKGEPEPRAYRLPWNKGIVEEIEEARQEQEYGGKGARVADINSEHLGRGFTALSYLKNITSPYNSYDVRLLPPPRPANPPKNGETPPILSPDTHR
jgi:hypothetical protein